MPTITDGNLDSLRREVRRLLQLLDDPQPGLMTWTGMLGESLDRVSSFLPRSAPPEPADSLDAALADLLAAGVVVRLQFSNGGHDKLWRINWAYVMKVTDGLQEKSEGALDTAALLPALRSILAWKKSRG